MASYTQTNRSVSTSVLNLLTSNVPYGRDWIAFADDNYYYCVYGTNESITDNSAVFVDATIQMLPRSYTTSQTITVYSEESTSISLPFPINVQSNIGLGVLTQTRVEEYSYNQVVTFGSSVLFALLLVTIGLAVIRKRWLV